MDRILLIEDDDGAQLLFRNRLQELGYEVVGASTGARGLLEARAAKFDLFIVDIGLGSGIDGYEVCRRLKAMPQNHGIPVVLISGQVKNPEELHLGYAAGCEAFLMKGDLTLIEDVVRAMLRIKALQNELASQNRLLEEQNRRLHEERQRAADLGTALRESGSRADVFRDLAAGRPDAVLLVDAEGVVRMTDRGARDVFGGTLEGKHLASIAPGTGLEAFVRDARTGAHEAYRFDLEWSSGATRSLTASILPTVPGGTEPRYKVLLLLDAGKRRVAAEVLRMEEQGVPRRELGPLLEAARVTFRPASMVGDSASMRELRGAVDRLRRGEGPVLLRGEPGTGKHLVARILHFSGEAGGPFVPLDAAALSRGQLQEELLGIDKGHSDALTARPGLFLRAQDGSIFLENVDRMPLDLQASLLAILREGRVKRVGSSQAEAVNVRLIASSTANLEKLAEKGRFDPELLALLAPQTLHTLPLRQRLEDVPALATHFLARYDPTGARTLSSEALWVLGEYAWPGNVRELEDCIEGALARSAEPELSASDLAPALVERFKELSTADSIPGPGGGGAGRRLREDPLAEAYAKLEAKGTPPSLEGYEKLCLLHALHDTGGDKLKAAQLLKIGKSTFYRKLKTHGLS